MSTEMLTTQPLTQELESSFYERKFYFSYSSLNRLLYCPEIFYKEYVLGNKEEKLESYLTEGKLIHCLLLEPEKFDQQFVTMTTKLPGENARLVVDRVFAHHQELLRNGATDRTLLQDYGDAILDILRDINLYQTLKTDQQRIDKLITPETVNYWTFLHNSQGKLLVDFDTLEKCKAIVAKFSVDSKLKDLLKVSTSDEWWSTEEVFSELPLQMELKKFQFGLKGIVDRVVIDAGAGVIRVMDLKTSSKTLKEFTESVKTYRYNLQAAVYNLLITNHYKDLLKQGYKIEFYFVVVDKFQQIYPFRVSEESMKTWTQELQEALKKADYHYSNKDYSLPIEFIEGVVL